MRSLKDGQKTIIKLFLFFFILAVMLLYIQAIMTPKWRFNLSSKVEGETDRYSSFYALPNHTVDYLTFGNSLTYRSINPTAIYASTGIAGYDLGNSMQKMDLSYYWLREALKTQSPSVVFIDITSLVKDTDVWDSYFTQAIIPMKFSRNKIEAVLNCKNDSQSFAELMFPLTQFHERWTSLTKSDWTIGHKPDYYLNGSYIDFTVRLDSSKSERIGYYEYDIIELSDDSQTVSKASLDVVEEYKYYFEQILELCEKNGIELIPVKGPTLSWSSDKSDFARVLMSGYGLEMLDLAGSNPAQIDWSNDTPDNGQHVNYWGLSKVSSFLADFLQEKGLPDHRGQDDYAVWDDTLQGYLEWEENQLLTTQESVYAYFNALEKAKNDCLIIVTVKDEASGAWNDTLEAAIHRLGVRSSFYNQIQNSFVAIIDGGVNKFEKWDDRRIRVNSNYLINDSQTLRLSVSSAGFMCGDVSTITVNGKNYSLNKRGLNIVVIDKQTAQVISSTSIDTHVSSLIFNQRSLPDDQAAVWQEICSTSQLIEDGVYNIIPFGNAACAIDIPGGSGENNENIWLWEKNGMTPQEFEFRYIGDGLYTIRAVCSDKYLSIENMGSTSESNVVQQAYSGLANQKWFITKNSNSTYTFTSLYNGQVLDVPYGVAEAGANIWVVGRNYKTPQQFFLKRVR